jgi:hypothetical protein
MNQALQPMPTFFPLLFLASSQNYVNRKIICVLFTEKTQDSAMHGLRWMLFPAFKAEGGCA